MRPELTSKISYKEFSEYYWLKTELQAFCRKEGMSTSGGKAELSERIGIYLTTGEKKGPIIKRRPKRRAAKAPLSLDTVISENHTCSQEVRAFFKSVIGSHFHFSTYIQDYFKHNPGKTYNDAVSAWHEEESRKKDPSYKSEIGRQFEYNRFIRDYYADQKNQGKSRAEAIAAWMLIKSRPGSNEYKSPK
ncbi:MULTISPECIES: DUF6434 domain-containing protein [Bacillaceae]|uniref:DUF6434 domain-containing protein n=1 Tax=Bacillaceae TaxID=186817 RepID=UPI002963CF29|nr:DUF6434 domain-containing protein [Bacillus infantis]MDW2877847.1 DUF6434 domain-containing protein [Bacillus infantis]